MKRVSLEILGVREKPFLVVEPRSSSCEVLPPPPKIEDTILFCTADRRLFIPLENATHMGTVRRFGVQ